MAKNTKAHQRREGESAHSKISTGMGASDDSSGGGNASGIPDADTGMREGGLPPKGNVEEDREKLFPEKSGAKKSSKRSKQE